MGHKKPEVTAKRRKMVGMFFKWVLRFYYKHTPTCRCGWVMKPVTDSYFDYQWKCIWKDCGWEAFDNGDGKLHWFRRNGKK